MHVNTMKVMMSVKVGLQSFDEFHFWNHKANVLQSQHLTNKHLEILHPADQRRKEHQSCILKASHAAQLESGLSSRDVLLQPFCFTP